MHICVRKGDNTIQWKGGSEMFDEITLTGSEVNDNYSLINTSQDLGL